MEYAISSESMRLSDENTIKKYGVSAIALMERAAHAIFNVIVNGNYNKIVVVCGSGNNGGDGYALALQLLDMHKNVKVFGKIPKTDAAKHYYDILVNKYKNSYSEISALKDIENYDLVVDCLLGIGIKGDLSKEYINYINIINTGKFIISCDIASGLNSDNGLISPVAVKADLTIAIQSYKTGHFLLDGKDYCGKLQLCDIGIEIIGEKYYICNDDFVKNSFLPRKNNSHKGSFGRCGIVACSKNFVGAGILATESNVSIMGECTMRVGSGYSYLFVPDKMISQLWGRVTHSCVYGHSELKNHKLDSIAFGMGIGENNKLFDTICNYNCLKVIDADGLNMLSKNMSKIEKLKGSVLTPHVMEFSRLAKIDIENILINPIEIAKSFAKKYNVILLLKGSTTIVTDGDKNCLNISGNSGLAKGGSGDVLSGIIAGLLAQKIKPFNAALVASYIAGITAENLSKTNSVYSILPLDIAKEVGNTLSKIIL